MKLNERGWGLKSLIIFSVIFIVILICTSFVIKNYIKQVKNDNKDKDNTSESTNIEKKTNSYIYQTLEKDLERAGESYAVYHSTLITFSEEYIIVNSAVLEQDGFSETIEDPVDGSPCDGYVKINPDGEVESFIKCSEYKTPKYDLWIE